MNYKKFKMRLNEIRINGIWHDVDNVGNFDDIDSSKFPDLDMPNWFEKADVSYSYKAKACRQFVIKYGIYLYIDTEDDFPINCVISDKPLIDHMVEWYNKTTENRNYDCAQFLSTFGINPIESGILPEAKPSDKSPFFIWCERSYRHDRGNYLRCCNGEIMKFKKYKDALKAIDRHYDRDSEGIKQRNVTDILTIVKDCH